MWNLMSFLRFVAGFLRPPVAPPRLQPMLRAQRKKMLQRLMPFLLGANSISAPLTLSFLYPANPFYALCLLVGIETLVLGYGVFLALRPDAALRTSSLATVSLLIGLCWATLPVLLFPTASSERQLVIACVIIALIATSLCMVPLLSVMIPLATTMVIGCVIALLQAWSLSGCRVYLLLLLELGIYTAYVFGLGCVMSVLLTRSLISNLGLADEQTRIARLLSRRSEAGGGEWLWETDAAGMLLRMPPALGRLLDLSGKGEARPLLEELARNMPSGAEWVQLEHCMRNHLFFRDVMVPLVVNGRTRVLSMTGQPRFEDATFAGYDGLGADVTAEYETSRQASFQATHDSLTGLPNRYAHEEAMRSALMELAHENRPFALLAFDQDDFKVINDTLGHAAGDLLLVEIARRLQQELPSGDMLCRIGGDEMVLIHRDATPLSATRLAARMLETIRQPMTLCERIIRPSMSIGIAFAPEAGTSSSAVQEAADLALYEAKRRGGNTCCVFHPSYRESAASQRDLIRDLREAISGGNITLDYNPVINAPTRQLAGFEALARWVHPQRGTIASQRFARLAEEAGLTEELGTYLIHLACETAMTWPGSLWVSVRVSSRQLCHPRFLENLHEILESTGLPARRLQLEISEIIFRDADATLLGILQALRFHGISVVLADFGKGYSSLGYLRLFAFSTLKLDASFVGDMLLDATSAAIVSAVIALAIDLGLTVRAEGVETWKHYERLRELGCAEAGGSLFGHPMCRAEVREQLALLSERRSLVMDPDWPLIEPDMSAHGVESVSNAAGDMIGSLVGSVPQGHESTARRRGRIKWPRGLRVSLRR